MELIDRRKLVSDFWQGVEDGAILSYEDTDNLMENAPTVDAVEVVHGKWIKRDSCWGKEIGFPTCSVCNTTWDAATNYCPSCGAKMDGGDTNDER